MYVHKHILKENCVLISNYGNQLIALQHSPNNSEGVILSNSYITLNPPVQYMLTKRLLKPPSVVKSTLTSLYRVYYGPSA